jgi:hypothetical protein
VIVHCIVINCVIIRSLIILIFVWYLPGSYKTWVACYKVWRKFAVCSHPIWRMLVPYHFYDKHCRIIRYFVWCRSMLFEEGLLWRYLETVRNILLYYSVTCADVSVTCSLWRVSRVRYPFIYRYTILQYMNISNGWVYVYWKL